MSPNGPQLFGPSTPKNGQKWPKNGLKIAKNCPKYHFFALFLHFPPPHPHIPQLPPTIRPLNPKKLPKMAKKWPKIAQNTTFLPFYVPEIRPRAKIFCGVLNNVPPHPTYPKNLYTSQVHTLTAQKTHF